MPVKKYSELIAWQEAMDLVEDIYRRTERFPKEERYGLRSQIRRAGVSVPSNIAEGQGQITTSSFLHHLAIAYGSLSEVETQILIVQRLGYLERSEIEGLMSMCSEVGRLINGLSKSLRKKKLLATDH